MYTRGIVLCLIMEDKLTINKEYAARYAKKKQAEELSKRKCGCTVHEHEHNSHND